jgi:uncharacterized protein (DUF3820 family)
MEKTLPFGKYKGRTIAEVLTGDPEYLRWLCCQDEFRSSRGALYRDIIDCVEGLVDAPARKVMRAWFQDVNFCRRFLRVCGYEAILLHELEARHAKAREQITGRLRDLKEMTSKAKNYTGTSSHQAWAQAHGIFLNPVDREQQIAGFEQMITTLHELHKRIPNQIEAPELKISCRFEQHGFDTILQAAIRYPWESDLRENYLGFQDDKIKSTVAIKIRETISPATIRWISENRSSPIADHIVLLAGRYNARFVEEMAAAEIKVVFAADLEAVATHAC